MKKTTVNQKKSTEDNQKKSSEKVAVIFRNAYFLKGNLLHPLTGTEQINSVAAVERKFRSAKELEQLVSLNHKTLFGPHSFFIPVQAKAYGLFGKGFDPAGFLFDLSDPAKPKFYVVEIRLSTQEFYTNIFSRLTRFLSYFKNQENFEKLCKIIGKNKKVEVELKSRMGSNEITDYLAGIIVNRSFILFVTDGEIKEMPEAMSVYLTAWQMVKTVFIRKYSSNGNTICTMVPSFSELHLNGKKRIPNAPVNEEYHLEDATDEIKSVYNKIKTELLKVNNQLQFNPQKYYISMRKDRNLAFFHFARKKISLVVMNSEKDTRKQIKNHEVKALTEKVQKFWNGPSCTIVIENSSNSQEVINLLKKLIKS
jgi:predicted transport protein